MTDSVDYINKSNDSTFNVVVYYKRYNGDKYYVIIKNGGLVTSQSIGRPKYKVVTNIDGDEHVVEYDNLKDAIGNLSKHKGLKSLDNQSQKYIKPIIQRMIGNHVYFSQHVSDRLLKDITDNIHKVVNNPYNTDIAQFNKLTEKVNKFNKLSDDITDQSSYNIRLKLIDQICSIARKIVKNCDKSIVDKVVTAVNLYNSYFPR